MALHQSIQRLLLLGVRFESFEPLSPAPPPARLAPLVEAIAAEHALFDQRALRFGHLYRSGFWAIYLLSAAAVLCAVLALGLGGIAAKVLAYCEIAVIGAVFAIYFLGHRRDWHGEWLRARTAAELTKYLPVLAPLLDLGATAEESNWYVRAFDPGQHLRSTDEVSQICTRVEPVARQALEGAWSDPEFVSSFVRWTAGILEQQRRYHCGVAAKQQALLHRLHFINACLFGLTALGAAIHVFTGESLTLSVLTTFFPALGASLHGALAQSEAYRLGATSQRLATELGNSLGRIQAALREVDPATQVVGMKTAIQASLGLILEEHHDWHLLVRPHHLPLG